MHNILSANNLPDKIPFVLYGPPGTGKTKTLVAAIEEIVRTTSKNVLVCANSNSACDEITERLLNVLSTYELFRLFSKSSNASHIKNCIRPICNYFQGNFKIPSLKFLYKFRVLICTLATAGCLSRARLEPDYDPNHFSYVMIDECASTHETMSLIAIAGKFQISISLENKIKKCFFLFE